MTDTEPGMPDGSSDLEGLAVGGKMDESAMVCVNVLELVGSSFCVLYSMMLIKV